MCDFQHCSSGNGDGFASRLDISPDAAQGQFEKFLGSANVEEIAIDAGIAHAAVECSRISAGADIPRD